MVFFGTRSCFKTLTDYGFSYIKSKQDLSRIWGFKIQHAVFTIHYHWSVDGLNLNLGAKRFLTGNIQNHPKPFPTNKRCWSVTSINQTSRNMFDMFHILFITSGSSKFGKRKTMWLGFQVCFSDLTSTSLHTSSTTPSGTKTVGLANIFCNFSTCASNVFGALGCCSGAKMDGVYWICWVEAKHISPFERVKKWLFLHCLENQKSSAFTTNRCFKKPTYYDTNDNKITGARSY